MPTLRKSKGDLAPLFDRLSDESPGVSNEPVPRRYLDLDGMAESIQREIQTLLNTRCTWGEAAIRDQERTVLDFGLVDLSHLYTDNERDKRRVARAVAQTIAAYEPRLTKVNVTVEAVRKETGRLDLLVSGGMRFGDVVEPISFPIRIDGTEVQDRGA